MGQHQCPKCERQFAGSDSLIPLISGICSEEIESETMSENEDSTMSDAETSRIVSEYDQELPQPQTADIPVAPRGRAAQPSRDTRKTN